MMRAATAPCACVRILDRDGHLQAALQSDEFQKSCDAQTHTMEAAPSGQLFMRHSCTRRHGAAACTVVGETTLQNLYRKETKCLRTFDTAPSGQLVMLHQARWHLHLQEFF